MSFIGPSGRSELTPKAVQTAESVTATPALALLKQAGLLPEPPANTSLLDNAAGGGILTRQLLDHASPTPQGLRIVCADLDLAMIDFLNENIRVEGWGNVTAVHADAHGTGFEDGRFDVVLMNFGPQLMRDPGAVLGETVRVVRPGGVLGFTAWIRPGFIDSMKAVFPDYGMGQTPLGGGWGDEGFVREKLAGLVEGVRVERCEFETEGDVDEYLELFVGVLARGWFEKVGEEGRRKYAEYMRGEGRMRMSWEALVVTGQKPRAG